MISKDKVPQGGGDSKADSGTEQVASAAWNETVSCKLSLVLFQPRLIETISSLFLG